MSPDGAFVAAGDYANAVRVYAARTGAPVWEKTAWAGKGAPFTWGLAFSGNSRTLAIGHWDAYAYVVDVTSWTEIATLKRQDRVYSVSLSHAGDRVAVGGRDKMAVVYSARVPFFFLSTLCSSFFRSFVFLVHARVPPCGRRRVPSVWAVNKQD